MHAFNVTQIVHLSTNLHHLRRCWSMLGRLKLAVIMDGRSVNAPSHTGQKSLLVSVAPAFDEERLPLAEEGATDLGTVR
jgi:hypothetical protein